jgi:SAM-dependent methyltransferase
MMANNLANAFFHRLSSKIARSVQLESWSRSGLTSGGERVDIEYTVKNVGPWPSLWRRMDIYEQTHYSRYVFASYSARSNDACADLACGTGYGSALLSEVCQSVLGVDRSSVVVEAAKQRYEHRTNLRFISEDLLSVQFDRVFDLIVSFETMEHFAEPDIQKLLSIYSAALKPSGTLIFSCPYRQPAAEAAKAGFHLTSEIDEDRVLRWLGGAGLAARGTYYQSYNEPLVQRKLAKPDFLVCVAQHV